MRAMDMNVEVLILQKVVKRLAKGLHIIDLWFTFLNRITLFKISIYVAIGVLGVDNVQCQ